MRYKLPSIPYPPSGSGFWSPVTATINWCEEVWYSCGLLTIAIKCDSIESNRSWQDYYASVYVAEIVNTFTNSIFIYLALVGISNCMRNKHPRVFLVAYVGYMFIGLASFFYHTSLKCSLPLGNLTRKRLHD